MKLFVTLLVAGFACHAALASPLNDRDTLEAVRQGKADASNYLDQVLANVREQLTLNGLDVIPMPNTVFGFEQKILGVIWHGEADLYNGSLHNMDTLHRTGGATVVTEPNGDMLISADVGVNAGQLDYTMHVSFMDLGPTVKVEGKLSRVRIMLQLRIPPTLKATIDKFDIKDTGLLTVDIKGLGAILNFLVELVTVFLGNLIKGIVVLFLEGTIRNMINDIIASILFPPSAFAALSNALPALF